MPNYTKLFNSIVTSTIWTEDDKTRILWITMLAMSDQNGEVHASIPGLARIAGIDIASTEKAIQAFLSPDPYSRTPDNEGRRIAKIDGGWELFNHAKYRAMASKEDSKAATAARVKRHRERKAVTECNASVTECNASVTVERDIAEAEAETKAEIKIPPNPQGGKERDSKNLPTSPEAIRISQLYGRRLTTKWSDKEIRAFKAIGPINADDLEIVCAYTEAEKAKGENGRQRRDLLTFLNNFTGEVDRAKAAPSVTPKQPQIKFLDD